MKEYHTISSSIDEIEDQITEKQRRRSELGPFVNDLLEEQPNTEYDEQLWRSMIDKVTVNADGYLVFKFFDGTEIEA